MKIVCCQWCGRYLCCQCGRYECAYVAYDGIVAIEVIAYVEVWTEKYDSGNGGVA